MPRQFAHQTLASIASTDDLPAARVEVYQQAEESGAVWGWRVIDDADVWCSSEQTYPTQDAAIEAAYEDADTGAGVVTRESYVVVEPS